MSAPKTQRIEVAAGSRVEIVVAAAPSAAAAFVDELVDRKRSGIEARAFDRLVTSGRVPSVRLGRKTYVRRSDLLALVQAAPPKPLHVVPDDHVDQDEIDRRVAKLRKAGR